MRSKPKAGASVGREGCTWPEGVERKSEFVLLSFQVLTIFLEGRAGCTSGLVDTEGAVAEVLDKPLRTKSCSGMGDVRVGSAYPRLPTAANGRCIATAVLLFAVSVHGETINLQEGESVRR